MIDKEERERRRAIVNAKLDQIKAEGGEVTPDVQALVDQWTVGEATTADLVEKIAEIVNNIAADVQRRNVDTDTARINRAAARFMKEFDRMRADGSIEDRNTYATAVLNSLRAEGLEPSAEGLEIVTRWARGEIDQQELLNLAMKQARKRVQ